MREVLALNAANAVDGYLIHAFADYHGSTPLLAQPDQNRSAALQLTAC